MQVEGPGTGSAHSSLLQSLVLPIFVVIPLGEGGSHALPVRCSEYLTDFLHLRDGLAISGTLSLMPESMLSCRQWHGYVYGWSHESCHREYASLPALYAG